MKYWEELEPPRDCEIPQLVLTGNRESEDYDEIYSCRVLAINLLKTGEFGFQELCDRYFGVIMTPEEAKAALLEAIDWIDEHRTP